MATIEDQMRLVAEMLESATQLYNEYMSRNLAELSPYSETINSRIRSVEELELYLSLGLTESHITRPALISDIDPDYFDYSRCESNLDKMLSGMPPIDPQTMKPFDIHHMGQAFDAPFVELPMPFHRGTGYYSILHDSNFESWRANGYLVLEFAKEKEQYWKRRGELFRENS